MDLSSAAEFEALGSPCRIVGWRSKVYEFYSMIPVDASIPPTEMVERYHHNSQTESSLLPRAVKMVPALRRNICTRKQLVGGGGKGAITAQ
jgi:hypothetical protein